ncbi:MAG TPA: hypothetical protein VEV43_06355 [Actinomycetota bacterium]|nr:hypothetical protein [Actinomycetota bacterium]
MAPVTAKAGDETCMVFNTIKGAPQGRVVRFVVGEDKQPREMTQAETEAELGDPFATLLLNKGVFPSTAAELLDAVDARVGANHPLGPSSHMSFVLGEGSQIPLADATPSTNAGLRFLVSRGSGPKGPDLIISTPGPDIAFVEVMAWDKKRKGFNYYRSAGPKRWAFAGNSRHALTPPTKGKGPFESHPSGNLIMKELRLPWVHWHSFEVDIFEDAFPKGDSRRKHPWFTQKLGAEICETAVVMPSITRWTEARLNQVVAANGTVTDPARVVEQIVTTPTVNLASSSRESKGAGPLDLPPGFFVDFDGLSRIGLPGPPGFSVSRAIYAKSLKTFDFRLDDGDGFVQPGDTHFAFVVPERAFEDTETLAQAVDRGLITRRLAAALLMVDFPNPVFSARRASLLKHAPKTATIKSGKSTYSDDMANAIIAAAAATPANSPEKEFVDRWNKAATLPGPLGDELEAYYDAIAKKLKTQAGFDDFVRLAESQRKRVRDQTRLVESLLLFPTTDVDDDERRAMKRDATVVLVSA